MGHSASNNLIKKMHGVLFSVPGGAKNKQFCEPLMADLSHYFHQSQTWDNCLTQDQQIEIQSVCVCGGGGGGVVSKIKDFELQFFIQ